MGLTRRFSEDHHEHSNMRAGGRPLALPKRVRSAMFFSVFPCMLLSASIYLYGLFEAVFAWDGLDEVCRSRFGVPLQPGYGRSTVFPPSRQCDAQHDTVSALVSPLMFALAGSAVVMVVLQLLSRDGAEGGGSHSAR